MGYIEESPFAQIKNIRLPQKIVQLYTVEEIGRLLACCDTRFYLGAPNRAMMLAFLDGGVRRTELVNLDLADLVERSGLTVPLIERKLKPLVGNRVLYPDGTVNSFVQRYFRERVLKLFNTKPGKSAKRA
jgi:site-specific recombinase XerD